MYVRTVNGTVYLADFEMKGGPEMSWHTKSRSHVLVVPKMSWHIKYTVRDHTTRL